MKHKPQRRSASAASAALAHSRIAPATDSDTDECSSGSAEERRQQCPHSARSSQPSESAPASPSPLQLDLDPDPRAAAPTTPADRSSAYPLGEFNDGTLSPLPSDPSFLHDPHLQAWHAMTAEEEAAYLQSEDYHYFAGLLVDGKLVLRESDLTSIQRWKSLGFFLTKSVDVQSLRFHGVDLQVGDFLRMQHVMITAALRNRLRRKKCNKELIAHGCGGDAASASASVLAPEWTGGWGVDVDALIQERRRVELSLSRNSLRHVIFCDNNLGTQRRVANAASVTQDEEVKNSSAAMDPPPNSRHSSQRSHVSSDGTAAPTALQNAISLLLLLELVESVCLWRNNLGDTHAAELADELLLKHPSLKKLSLRWNGVTADGAQKLACTLRQLADKQQQQQQPQAQTHPQSDDSDAVPSDGGCQFEELDLSANRIDPAGERKLRDSLASLPATFAGDSPRPLSSFSPSPSPFRPSPRKLTPFFINLQYQLSMPYTWRTAAPSASGTGSGSAYAHDIFSAHATFRPNTLPRTVRPAA